jgi:ABC-type uncharacterized transport system substrate-binding protein
VRGTRALWSLMILLAGSITVRADEPEKKRVFHLDSYSKGYGISDDTGAGLRSVLRDKPVQVSTFFMDTKRHSGEAEIKDAVARARAAIEAFRPDVIVASDDAAVKYVVVPYYKDGPIPVVFCGVNWSAEPYGLPTAHVTGMVEVVPVLEAVDLARKYYPNLRRLGVLSEDSLSERNNKALLEPKYRAVGLEVTYVMAADFATWKREFERLQDAVDVLYLPTQGAVRDWDAAEAAAFVKAKTRKPSIATDDFMTPYALIGLAKTQLEQGEWAGKTALEILDGKQPAAIPVVRNRRRVAYVNATLAARLRFVPGPELAGAKIVH